MKILIYMLSFRDILVFSPNARQRSRPSAGIVVCHSEEAGGWGRNLFGEHRLGDGGLEEGLGVGVG